MEAQGIAVAEAVTGAFRFVPARLMIYFPPQRLLRSVASNEPLAPPWPRLLVFRRSADRAHCARAEAGSQGLRPAYNPKVPKHRFDLIAAPVHDRYTGGNVINTFGAVHSVTAERLAGSVESFAAKIDPLPPPARRRAAWRR